LKSLTSSVIRKSWCVSLDVVVECGRASVCALLKVQSDTPVPWMRSELEGCSLALFISPCASCVSVRLLYIERSPNKSRRHSCVSVRLLVSSNTPSWTCGEVSRVSQEGHTNVDAETRAEDRVMRAHVRVMRRTIGTSTLEVREGRLTMILCVFRIFHDV